MICVAHIQIIIEDAYRRCTAAPPSCRGGPAEAGMKKVRQRPILKRSVLDLGAD